MKTIVLLTSLLISGSVFGQETTQPLILTQDVLPNSISRQQTRYTMIVYNRIQSQASAFYTATQSITLQPGFETQTRTVFEATISSISSINVETMATLHVRVLGNPIVGNQAQVIISGSKDQAVTLRLVDTQGLLVHEQHVEPTGLMEPVSVPLGISHGLLLLHVNTASQQQTVKLLRL